MVYGLLFIFFLLTNFFVVALQQKVQLGSLSVKNTRNGSIIASDTGIIKLLPNLSVLKYSFNNTKGEIKYIDILKLSKVRHSEDEPILEAINGLNITDFLPEYRDKMIFQTVYIETTSINIPIYVAKQYNPREFLENWYISIQVAILEFLGFHQNIDDVANKAFTKINKTLVAADINFETELLYEN